MGTDGPRACHASMETPVSVLEEAGYHKKKLKLRVGLVRTHGNLGRLTPSVRLILYLWPGKRAPPTFRHSLCQFAKNYDTFSR